MWVILELERTPEPKRTDCISLLDPIQLLQTDAKIDSMVDAYIRYKIMPADADGDTRHLAIATYWNCDVLATWNCRHLANANKTGHIRRVND